MKRVQLPQLPWMYSQPSVIGPRAEGYTTATLDCSWTGLSSYTKCYMAEHIPTGNVFISNSTANGFHVLDAWGNFITSFSVSTTDGAIIYCPADDRMYSRKANSGARKINPYTYVVEATIAVGNVGGQGDNLVFVPTTNEIYAYDSTSSAMWVITVANSAVTSFACPCTADGAVVFFPGRGTYTDKVLTVNNSWLVIIDPTTRAVATTVVLGDGTNGAQYPRSLCYLPLSGKVMCAGDQSSGTGYYVTVVDLVGNAQSTVKMNSSPSHLVYSAAAERVYASFRTVYSTASNVTDILILNSDGVINGVVPSAFTASMTLAYAYLMLNRRSGTLYRGRYNQSFTEVFSGCVKGTKL